MNHRMVFSLFLTLSSFIPAYAQSPNPGTGYPHQFDTGAIASQAGPPLPVLQPAPHPQIPFDKSSQQFEKPLNPLVTFTVSTTNDTGAGSLRKAITDANASPVLSAITFTLPGGSVIIPLSPFPTITNPVIIDGTNSSGLPGVEIDGEFAGTGTNGFIIKGGSSAVRGLIINRFGSLGGNNGFAIILDVKGGNVIQGNYLGTDPTGMIARPNGGSGVGIFGTSSGNLIGGTTPQARNLISGNLVSGVQTTGSGANSIQGNYIGVNVFGTTAIPNTGNGINIDAPNDTIGGSSIGAGNVLSGNGMPGIYISINGSYATIQGNFIGTDRSGSTGIGNLDAGVYVVGAHDVAIGNSGAGAGNVISANKTSGIYLIGPTATRNTIQGNFIGTNASGTLALPNIRNGIVVDNAPSNIIGGSTAGQRNIISGNLRNGILTNNVGATGNRILGNYIGVDIRGTGDLGNGAYGVLISSSQDTVGGLTVAEGNVIAFNHGAGIYDSSGTGNLFRMNSIFSQHNGFGIDLAPRGLARNDSLDGDAGPNGLQNFPLLDSVTVTAGSTTIHGRFNSMPNKSFIIDFYSNAQASPSHFGEGELYIGSTALTTDAGGNAFDANGHPTFHAALPIVLPLQRFFTATATEIGTGNTSEFSQAFSPYDQDGDGIYDFWETEGWGIDVNSDSLIDLDLYSRRARPDHKDIFVEVDAMLSFGPDIGALGDVEQVFNAAPVSNPDGTSGIHLHVRNEVSDLDVPDALWNTGSWPTAQFDAIKKVYFGTNREKGNPQALQAKSLVYRYCLCINKFDGGVSGIAHIDNAPGSAGNDFIVSLGGWAPAGGNRHDFAGTFMHELGHTLGLLHGGADNVLFKPNYYSVMNYTFQVEHDAINNPQLPVGSWRLWYSSYALDPLDENHLDESKGLNPPLLGNPPRRIFPKVLIPYSRPDGKIANAVLAENTGVNWDGIGDSIGVCRSQFDLTHIDPANFRAQPVQVLNSFDDWANLKLGFRDSPNFQPFSSTAAPASPLKIAAGDTVKEMDVLMRDRLRALPPYGIIEPLDEWSHNAASPIIISRDPYSQRYPVSVADTQGGAYIVWQDFHYPGNDKRMVTEDHMRLYVQHVDAFGQQVWPGALAVVAQGPGDQMLQNIIQDGNGGVIIIWGEQNCEISGCWQNVFAQRINAGGYYRADHNPRVWGDAGVMIGAPRLWDVEVGHLQVTGDGIGGAIFTWYSRASNYLLYAQRVSATGAVKWAPEGVELATKQDWGPTTSDPAIATDDSSGAYIAWADAPRFATTATTKVYVQRVGPDGQLLWGPQGVAVSATASSQSRPAISPDGGGGAIVSWEDMRALTVSSVFAQRFDRKGTPLWTTGGVSQGTGNAPRVLGEKNGSAIVAWSGDNGTRIRMQKIDQGGVTKWNGGGVIAADSVALNPPNGIPIGDDGAGGALVAYASFFNPPSRTSAGYVQRIDSTGQLPWGMKGVEFFAGGASGIRSSLTIAPDGKGGGVVAWEDAVDSTHYINSQYEILAHKINGRGGFGNTPVTAIIQRGSLTPGEYRLDQNYPNPFNPSTTIRFALPNASHVSIIVYDILGRKVRALVDQQQSAGSYAVIWDGRNDAGTNVASGVYFLSMRAEGPSGASLYQKLVKALLLK